MPIISYFLSGRREEVGFVAKVENCDSWVLLPAFAQKKLGC